MGKKEGALNMYKWDQLPVPIWILSAIQWILCSCGLNMELQCEVLRINYRRGMHKGKIS